MVPRLAPYVEYREFGDEWVRRIPATWSIRKLKYLADVRPSGVDKKIEPGERQVRLCNYTDVYNNEVIGNGMHFMVASASDEEFERFKLKADDVVVTKDSETWDDIAVPAYVSEDLGDVVCGYHLAVVRPMQERVFGRFLFYAFKAKGIVERFHVEALGVTRFALNQDALRSVRFPVPPLNEQRGITGFLDREMVRLERIAPANARDVGGRIGRLLTVLREYRTALISAAVTGQIDVSER